LSDISKDASHPLDGGLESRLVASAGCGGARIVVCAGTSVKVKEFATRRWVPWPPWPELNHCNPAVLNRRDRQSRFACTNTPLTTLSRGTARSLTADFHQPAVPIKRIVPTTLIRKIKISNIPKPSEFPLRKIPALFHRRGATLPIAGHLLICASPMCTSLANQSNAGIVAMLAGLQLSGTASDQSHKFIWEV
jgi:hypothetical protein